MAVFASSMLTIVSAALTFASVRYAEGARRKALLGAALLSFALASLVPDAFGGFWARFYSLCAIYFLACIALPWLDLLRVRNAR